MLGVLRKALYSKQVMALHMRVQYRGAAQREEGECRVLILFLGEGKGQIRASRIHQVLESKVGAS